MTDIEAEMFAALQEETAKEILELSGITLTDEEFEQLWSKCGGNPWDIVIMHDILKLTKE